MTWRARAALAVANKATPEPTKPTEAPSVSYVSPHGRHFPRFANDDPIPDLAAEARRQRVIAMLAVNPALRIAVVCDGEGDPVPVAVGIRDKGTCEVHIPAARFDPFALFDLATRHGGTVH